MLYSEGCKNTVGGSWEEDVVNFLDPEENRKLITQAVATAQKADTVILVLGDNEQTSREAWSKVHLGDRASLELFGMQNELVKAVVETGKPIVVLIFNGRPNSIGYVAAHVPAIVECWYWVRKPERPSRTSFLEMSTPGENCRYRFRGRSGIYRATTITNLPPAAVISSMISRHYIRSVTG